MRLRTKVIAMNRMAYVDTQILFMCWNPEKNGWVPDMSTMQQHRNGNLRVYQPDEQRFLITMPGKLRWPLQFDADNIREVLEMPWVPAAFHGMDETEIDELDPTIPAMPIITEPLKSIVVNIPPLLDEQPKQTPLPDPLPKHIEKIVLEQAEHDRKLCSITLEPICQATGTVTSCGHLFKRSAIREWLSEHQTCPECRKICSVRK
jgi:hypothetical protein